MGAHYIEETALSNCCNRKVTNKRGDHLTLPIAQINLRKLNMPLKHPFTNSLSTLKDRELLITEVLDTQGNRGFGEGVAFSAPWYTEETVETSRHMIADFLIPKLKEQPIRDRKSVV